MSIYGAPNPVVRPILRSRFHRVLSGFLLLVTVTGRKTGKRHTFPVMYARDGADIVIVAGWASKKRWWKNLIGGGDVTVQMAGETLPGRGTTLVDATAERGRTLRAYLTRFPAAVRTVGAPRDWRTASDESLAQSRGDAAVVRVVLAR
ncbi:MAG: nitroreductase family deazaflavin-dependent oxidoreductase [bacterium]